MTRTAPSDARLEAELARAREQQAATFAVLRAMAASPSDDGPVLQAIAENAARYCDAPDVSVLLARGDEMRVVAHHGPIPSATLAPARVDPASIAGAAVLERRTVHVADVNGPEGERFAQARIRSANTGQRGVLASPLLRQGVAIGVILLRKLDTSGFDQRQIELVEAFADQAVIAIENVRLFKETKESLKQQTAVSDVLRSISRSAFDLDTVLQTITERAASLIEAEVTSIFRREGDEVVTLAQFGQSGSPGIGVGMRVPIDSSTLVGRAVASGKRQYVADARAHPELPQDGTP
ncbi:MAG: GAF domain-containing protein, partial [Chloroflexota bacterium]|nr:GAF domain-containing protein [Chloroflexota bacterium]